MITSRLTVPFAVLYRLQTVAGSATDDEYEQNLLTLSESSEYATDSAIQTWIEHKWLPHRHVRTRHSLMLVLFLGLGP